MKTKDFILIALVVVGFWLSNNQKANEFLFGKNQKEYVSDTIFHSPSVIRVDVPDPVNQQISAQEIRRIVQEAIENNNHELLKENIFLKEHAEYLNSNPDSLYGEIKVYKDSSVHSDVNIYYSALTRGELLNLDLRYRQKGVKSITTTSFEECGKLYLTGSAGIGSGGVMSLSPGLFYSGKGRFGAGYEYNLLNGSHSGKIGVKIFSHK